MRTRVEIAIASAMVASFWAMLGVTAAAGAPIKPHQHFIGIVNGVMNLAWAGGLVIGQVGGGALAQAFGDEAAYAAAALVIAGLLVVTVACGSRRIQWASTGVGSTSVGPYFSCVRTKSVKTFGYMR